MAGATRAFNGVRLVWGCESFGPGFGQGLDPADSDAALAEIVDGVSKLPGIARVALDISPKPPATTEWE